MEREDGVLTTSGRDSFRCVNVMVELSVTPRSATTSILYGWKEVETACKVVKL